MPAPLAKGLGSSHPPNQPNHPLTTGIIIAASVLVAAGIAIYENPQVRQWVDQSRRKIAVALHSLGDDIQPRRQSESSDDFEARAKRREELIRRNRNELVRRAREEGVAVDLDELARIGDEAAEQGRKRRSHGKSDRTKSFDTLVGEDGMLRGDTTATTTNSSDAGLRKRGVTGFAAGSAAAAAMSNPFSDDAVLFDHSDDQDGEAPSPQPFPYLESTSRESSTTLPAASPPSTAGTLIDLTPDTEAHPQPSNNAPLEVSETEAAAQSFYSFTSSPSRPSTPTHPATNPTNNPTSPLSPFSSSSENAIPTPTLTPRSTRSLSLSSTSTTPATDAIAIHSMQNSMHSVSPHNDSDADTRSEVFSEGGFTDAGFSEAGFSEFAEGERETGVMTPSSWTDVGSEEGSEWGGLVGGSGVYGQGGQ